MKKLWKKIKYKLQLFDSFWSIPLAFIGTWLYGLFQEYYFNDPSYTLQWFNKAVMNSLILILFNGVVQLGMWFNFRGLHRYFYGKEVKEDFKKLPVWLKVFSYIFVYSAFMVALIVMNKK